MAGRSRVSELTGHGQREILEVVWPVGRFCFCRPCMAVLLFLVVITDCFFCLLVLATVLYFCLKSLDCLDCYWLFDK